MMRLNDVDNLIAKVDHQLKALQVRCYDGCPLVVFEFLNNDTVYFITLSCRLAPVRAFNRCFFPFCVPQAEQEEAEQRLYTDFMHPEQMEEERGTLEIELKENQCELDRVR